MSVHYLIVLMITLSVPTNFMSENREPNKRETVYKLLLAVVLSFVFVGFASQGGQAKPNGFYQEPKIKNFPLNFKLMIIYLVVSILEMYPVYYMWNNIVSAKYCAFKSQLPPDQYGEEFNDILYEIDSDPNCEVAFWYLGLLLIICFLISVTSLFCFHVYTIYLNGQLESKEISQDNEIDPDENNGDNELDFFPLKTNDLHQSPAPKSQISTTSITTANTSHRVVWSNPNILTVSITKKWWKMILRGQGNILSW